MNKVATGSLWATSLLVAGTLAGCGSGAPRRSVSVCAGGSFSAPLKIVRGSGT